jgi:hypothetical protein
VQWLLSLPTEAKTFALQQQVAQQVSTDQWAADRRAWWSRPPQNQYLNPGNSALQAQLLQKLAQLKDKHSSSSSSGRGSQGGDGSGSDSEDDSDDVRVTNEGYGADDVSPDDIVVVEELGAVEEDESSDDDDSSDGGPAAAAAAGSGSQLAGYPCPLPLTYIVTLPKEVRGGLLLVLQRLMLLPAAQDNATALLMFVAVSSVACAAFSQLVVACQLHVLHSPKAVLHIAHMRNADVAAPAGLNLQVFLISILERDERCPCLRTLPLPSKPADAFAVNA